MLVGHGLQSANVQIHANLDCPSRFHTDRTRTIGGDVADILSSRAMITDA